MRKIVLIAVLVVIGAIVTLVFALPTNWFQVAEVSGVIVQTQTGTVKAIINLGTISSGSGFSASGSGTITVAEAGGLNLTMFMASYPGAFDNTKFYDLDINVTIDLTERSIPFVKNGGGVADWHETVEGSAYLSWVDGMLCT